jgi:carbon storage regulator
MLVVTRKEGESIVIGDSIVVSVSSIRGNRVRLAIEAPREIGIGRSETPPRNFDLPRGSMSELCGSASDSVHAD